MEKFHPEVADPAPRGHRTLGKGASGKEYFKPLEKSALESDVQVLRHCPARRLLTDRDGRVIGVEAEALPESVWQQHQALYHKVDPMKPFNSAKAETYIAKAADLESQAPAQRVRLRAHRGVVLASGGYNYNLELYSKYRPDITGAAATLVRGGSMGCDGSGIELGISAGGAIDCMQRVFLSKAISPPEAFSCGVLVGQDGSRLLNEDAYLGKVGDAVAGQSNGRAWVILDSPTFWQGIRQLLWPISNALSWWGGPALMNVVMGGTRRAGSIEALAGKARYRQVGTGGVAGALQYAGRIRRGQRSRQTAGQPGAPAAGAVLCGQHVPAQQVRLFRHHALRRLDRERVDRRGYPPGRRRYRGALRRRPHCCGRLFRV